MLMNKVSAYIGLDFQRPRGGESSEPVAQPSPGKTSRIHPVASSPASENGASVSGAVAGSSLETGVPRTPPESDDGFDAGKPIPLTGSRRSVLIDDRVSVAKARESSQTARRSVMTARGRRSTFKSVNQGFKRTTMFISPESLLQGSMNTIDQPDYDVQTFYKQGSIWTRIVVSDLFCNLTLFIIVLNAKFGLTLS